MAAAARVGDPDSGGDKIANGSPDVFINGKPVARVGDKDTHKPPETKIEGSSSVFVNGKPVVRVGDKDTHQPPHVITSGSPDVFVA